MNRHQIVLPSGQRISYLEAGPVEGHTVVLLHGGGADNAELSWGPTIRLLAEHGYHLIAPDHPGYGRSPRSVNYATMDNQVAYVDEFIETLDLQDYDLVGVSMGGGMAIGHTLKHLDQVRKLVLVASYGYQMTLAAQPMLMTGSWMPWLTEMIQWTSWNPFTVGFGLTAVLAKSVVSDELADGVRRAALDTPALATFNEFQRHELGLLGNRTNYSNRLHEITQPVLLIHGEHDIIFPVNDARTAATLFPNVHLEILPSVGHWAQRDDPETVHALILDFLTDASGFDVVESDAQDTTETGADDVLADEAELATVTEIKPRNPAA